MHEQTFMHVNGKRAPLYAFTILHARAILSNHQHNLWCCPHESFPYREIRETEVTCCHKAEQTQINNLAVTLAFTYSNSLSHRRSFNSSFFPYTCIIMEYIKSPLLVVKSESVASFLYSKFRHAIVVDLRLLVRFQWDFYCCDTHLM